MADYSTDDFMEFESDEIIMNVNSLSDEESMELEVAQLVADINELMSGSDWEGCWNPQTMRVEFEDGAYIEIKVTSFIPVCEIPL